LHKLERWRQQQQKATSPAVITSITTTSSTTAVHKKFNYPANSVIKTASKFVSNTLQNANDAQAVADYRVTTNRTEDNDNDAIAGNDQSGFHEFDLQNTYGSDVSAHDSDEEMLRENGFSTTMTTLTAMITIARTTS
jgi:hypothetical protein